MLENAMIAGDPGTDPASPYYFATTHCEVCETPQSITHRRCKECGAFLTEPQEEEPETVWAILVEVKRPLPGLKPGKHYFTTEDVVPNSQSFWDAGSNQWIMGQLKANKDFFNVLVEKPFLTEVKNAC